MFSVATLDVTSNISSVLAALELQSHNIAESVPVVALLI